MKYRERVKIETADVSYHRRFISSSVNLIVDQNVDDPVEQSLTREEMESWLDRVWADLPNNILLPDNPNFNFTEPLHISEPEDVLTKLRAKEDLAQRHQLLENTLKARREMIQTLQTFRGEQVKAESEIVLEAQMESETLPSRVPLSIPDVENLKGVEPTYRDSIHLLKELDDKIPLLDSDYHEVIKCT